MSDASFLQWVEVGASVGGLLIAVRVLQLWGTQKQAEHQADQSLKLLEAAEALRREGLRVLPRLPDVDVCFGKSEAVSQFNRLAELAEVYRSALLTCSVVLPPSAVKHANELMVLHDQLLRFLRSFEAEEPRDCYQKMQPVIQWQALLNSMSPGDIDRLLIAMRDEVRPYVNFAGNWTRLGDQ
jgi:hypothetical protein